MFDGPMADESRTHDSNEQMHFSESKTEDNQCGPIHKQTGWFF